MTSGVQATVSQQAMTRRSPQLDLLLRHCLAFEYAPRRPPASVRLDEALGPALARRLVTSLTAGRR